MAGIPRLTLNRQSKRAEHSVECSALCWLCVRRCPTLPHPWGGSTIGAERLSFRVRDGTGRFPFAVTAVTRLYSFGGVLSGARIVDAAFSVNFECGVQLL